MQVLEIDTKTDKNKENLFSTEHLYKSDDNYLHSIMKLHKKKHVKDHQLIQEDSFLNPNYKLPYFIFFSIYLPYFWSIDP